MAADGDGLPKVKGGIIDFRSEGVSGVVKGVVALEVEIQSPVSDNCGLDGVELL